MRLRFGWNIPNLSGLAVLLTYCTAAASTGCAAAPWDRTMPSQPSAAAHATSARSPEYPGDVAAPAANFKRTSARMGTQDASPTVQRASHQTAAQPAAATGRDHALAQRYYEKAQACWKQGDGDGTKRYLDDALTAHPRHRDANLLLAEWCLLANRPHEATSRIAQLCRERPNDARAFHTLGTLLAATGRDRDALALYERAARLAPGDSMYHYTVDAASGRSQRGTSGDLLTGSMPPAQAASPGKGALATSQYEPAPLSLNGKASATVLPAGEQPRRLDHTDVATMEPTGVTSQMDEHAEVFHAMTSPTARAAMLTGASNSKRSRGGDRVCSVCSSDPPRGFEPQSAQPLVAAQGAEQATPDESDRLRLRLNSGPVSEAGHARTGELAEDESNSQVQRASAAVDSQPVKGSSLRLKADSDASQGEQPPAPRRTRYYDSSSGARSRPASAGAAVRSVPPETHNAARKAASQEHDEAGSAANAEYAALLSQAEQAYQADQLDQGRRFLQQAAKATAVADDREAAEVTVAVEAMRQAENALAIQLLEPASARPDATARIFRTLGTAYYRTGEFPLAAEALERAVSLDSSSALSYFLLGSTLNKLGKQREAAEALQRAAQLDPRYGDRR